MGTINHNAIIVTDSKDSRIEAAHSKATELGCIVTAISPYGTNGYRSFLVCPDGSKEWWQTSDEHNARRDAFVEWLMQYEDGAGIDWVEVAFGELCLDCVGDARIVRGRS